MGSEANRKHFRQCFQKCVSNFRSLWLSIRATEGVPPVIVLWQGIQVCSHCDTSWICLCLTEFFCFGGCDAYALPGQLSASLEKLSTESLHFQIAQSFFSLFLFSSQGKVQLLHRHHEHFSIGYFYWEICYVFVCLGVPLVDFDTKHRKSSLPSNV